MPPIDTMTDDDLDRLIDRIIPRLVAEVLRVLAQRQKRKPADPEGDAEMMRLHDQHGMTYQEVGSEYGMTREAARSAIRRAREREHRGGRMTTDHFSEPSTKRKMKT